MALRKYMKKVAAGREPFMPAMKEGGLALGVGAALGYLDGMRSTAVIPAGTSGNVTAITPQATTNPSDPSGLSFLGTASQHLNVASDLTLGLVALAAAHHYDDADSSEALRDAGGAALAVWAFRKMAPPAQYRVAKIAPATPAATAAQPVAQAPTAATTTTATS